MPDGLRVVREQELRMEELLRRNPDLMIVHAEAVRFDRYSYEPSDVVIAIEVVSPSTETTGRLHNRLSTGPPRLPTTGALSRHR